MLSVVRQLEVRQLSATSTPPDGRVVIVLKASYDHGNDIVTLAGYSARERDWPEFEDAWKAYATEAWAKCDMPRGVQPYLHTTDHLLAGDEPFTRNRGWVSDSQVSDWLNKCTVLLHSLTTREKIRGVACSVLLQDYKKVRKDGVALPSVADICVSFCAASAVAWNADFAEEFLRDGAELYFDQNGPFHGALLNRKRHGKLRKSPAWNKLLQISQVNSKISPAVQAAGLLAWSINAYYAKTVRGDWQLAMVTIPRENLFLDEHSLRNPQEDQLARLLALKLPNHHS
jgi:hypothetical protein